MSQTLVGPVQAVYVGDVSASGVLLRLPLIRTKGTTITDTTSYDTKPVASYKQLQSGWRNISFSLSFYSTDDILVNLSRGLLISNSNPDDTPGTNQYVVVLVAGSSTTRTSYYFPVLNTKHNLAINLNKDNPTEVGIDFAIANRDVSVSLMYKNTVAAISSLLGARSPF